MNISLKKLIPETMIQEMPSAQSVIEFDTEDILGNFKDAVEGYTAKEKSRSEQELEQKLKGKTISLRASKGYKQAQKDYTITVRDVDIEWHYEDYFVVLKDEKNDAYFTVAGFPAIIQAQGDRPTTSLTQNLSIPSSTSQHTVKQF